MIETEKSIEAVSAAAGAAAAVEESRAEQFKKASQESEQRMTAAMAGALRDVFGKHQRFDQLERKGRTPATDINISVLATDIGYIKRDVAEIKEKLDHDYISREEFDAKFSPVQKLVYGLVGLILIGVVGAMLALVVLKPGTTQTIH